MPRRLHRQDIELGSPHHEAIACAIKDAACAMKDIARRRLHLKSIAFATAVIASISLSAPTFASDGDASEIHFRNGRFEPAQLVVPANTPFKVQVTNSDTAAIEFESFELHRERVVRGGWSACKDDKDGGGHRKLESHLATFPISPQNALRLHLILQGSQICL